MRNKILVALIFICILSISINIFQFNKISNYKNVKLNNLLAFTIDDVKEIMVLEGEKVLSYNYKIEPEIALQISNQIIISSKERRKEPLIAPYSDGTIINIFFKDDDNSGIKRFITIMSKDDNSVFVTVKTQTKYGGSIDESWVWSVESSWLSQYINTVKKDL